MGLRRQHDGKLNHQEPNLALWVTQKNQEEMLHKHRIGNGTLFSLRVQGADVTTKTSAKNQMANESKIMNAPIVSAEANARLNEAVKNYTPPAPEKYRALNEVKEAIVALRERKASYETIRVMLHENTNIEVSHQTVARYCRKVWIQRQCEETAPPKDAAAQRRVCATDHQVQASLATGGHADRTSLIPGIFRRCNECRHRLLAAIKERLQSSPSMLKARAFGVQHPRPTRVHSRATRASRGRTGRKRSRVRFREDWQRRSGARLHSCRFADRLPDRSEARLRSSLFVRDERALRGCATRVGRGL